MTFLLPRLLVAQISPFAPASAIAPLLSFAKSNDNLIASWFISPFDFALESTTGLPATGAWMRIQPNDFTQAECRVTIPATNEQSFFRLVGQVSSNGLATMPLFQFGVFYAVDLEITPGQPWVYGGTVHGSSNMYVVPFMQTFRRQVTAAGTIFHNSSPGDPLATNRTLSSVIYEAGRRSDVPPLTFGLGTNLSPLAMREILEVPTVGESSESLIGQERFYNKADLVITASNNSTTVTSGRLNNFGTVIPPSQWGAFVRVGTNFFNWRENKNVSAIELDVARLRLWNATNTLLRPVLPEGDIKIVYVKDGRMLSSTNESGVRLVNGTNLLPRGLTIATPSPIYMRGNYNIMDDTGTSSGADTTHTRPAAILGDAITVLSGAWNDALSAAPIGLRWASNTTVNAALVGGIVATTTNSYSGGVENLPRLLEGWGARTFAFNGSLVGMFYSQFATGPYGTADTYFPPVRAWNFDTNFLNHAKLPPGTPVVGVPASP